ncbi:BCAS3 microtubule associated cell migration factor-like isoform X3 [Homarus americanus]|uniref:BCAS3 microtubule associated cell migration factor-like isoform X3 n=1 Tax=Homarus americanus TaxID=6706 RepID=UPI001C497610|nr:BCAS3 microtubule associated cell migration factor-like isoform X3 [Homarus americanus]
MESGCSSHFHKKRQITWRLVMSSAMSGESGRGSRPSVGQQVRPEPVVEKTFVENVAGFINEVAPQTYSNPSHYEGKETILWVRFDYCDINDLARFRDKIEVNGNSPPLLLIIGYGCGVQAWVIPVNGEAMEVLSWRQGAVRTLKVLPTPATSASTVDHYSLKRPIIALCDTAGPGPQFCSVSFISLKTGEQVKTIKFKHPVYDIHANKNVVVIAFPEKLAVFDAATLEDTFTVTTCYPCPGPSVNPIALGDRWLAYADRRLVPLHQSCGGMVPEGSTSYKATVFHAAKSLTKGLKELSESVASNLMGQRVGSPAQQTPPTNLPTPGIVTIIDTQMVGTGEISLMSSGTTSGIVAHFCAHHGAPIVALSFDPTGMLLLTADKQGHNFHLFRLQPHPLSAAQSAIHHLYTLHRGDTTAKVTDISFSLDSRWVAVSTHRGTTHVFPITPYGGSIGVRTHTSNCVVNRLSRFHRSAGLDDTPSSGRNSPVLSASPSSSKFVFEVSPNLAYPNPRYPPYPSPTIIKPLVQLRQPLLQNLIGTMGTGPSPSRSPPSSKSPRSPSGDDIIKVASLFGSPRGWLAGSPTVPRDKQRRTMDSLFVMAYHGNLLEYHLEPHPAAGIPQDKVTEDSPIELEVHASAQWALVRESTSGELRPPLDMTSPLLAPLSPTRPRSLSPAHSFDHDDPEERWMAQVEIHTHAGPHRRLWMGPQFTFKSIPGVGVGYGGGGSQGGYEGTPISGSSMDRPPRSSPVNMPGTGGANVPVLIEAGSLTGSHDQSPRLMERYSGDSDSFDPETMMTQLRHDLADAMLDTQHAGHRGDTGGKNIPPLYRRLCSLQSLGPQLLGTIVLGEDGAMTSHGETSHDSALDMTDVMDISCDPPGPSSGRALSSTASPSVSRISSRPSSHVGEEIQAVTPRLHQVAVTHPDLVRASPYIQRTPSLEDNRALTSSAEELSSTLGSGFRVAELADSVWVPIDRPEIKSSSHSPEFVQIDKPEVVSVKAERESSMSPRETRFTGSKVSTSTRITVPNSGEGSSVRQLMTSPTRSVSSDKEVIKTAETTITLRSRMGTTGKESLTPSKNPNNITCDARISPEASTNVSRRLVGSSDKPDYLRCVTDSSATETQDSYCKEITVEDDKKFEIASKSNVWVKHTAKRTSPKSYVSEEAAVPQEDMYPPLGKSVSVSAAAADTEHSETCWGSRNKTKKPPSTTTSEDDLWLATENKKEKKKKKKNKILPQENEPQLKVDMTHMSESQNILIDISESSDRGRGRVKSKQDDDVLPSKEPETQAAPLDIDIDVDYFHTAEEYHEPPVERFDDDLEDFQRDCFLEPQVEDFQEAQESAIQTLEDFELQADEEDREVSSHEPGEAMLRSLHDDNDLARALEEAYSSDDNVPVRTKTQTRTHSRSRPCRASEMFPFKDETSDDEEEVRLRRRIIVSATVTTSASRSSATEETSTDDRGETSGDDRGESSADDRKTATSESDVGASPNPRTNSSSKSKKKKKKKR